MIFTLWIFAFCALRRRSKGKKRASSFQDIGIQYILVPVPTGKRCCTRRESRVESTSNYSKNIGSHQVVNSRDVVLMRKESRPWDSQRASLSLH